MAEFVSTKTAQEGYWQSLEAVGYAMSESCAHRAMVEGYCRECGFCLHEVILNGACMACSEDDLAVTIKPDEPSNVVPLSQLVRKSKPD